MKNVYVTSYSSISSLGISNNDILKNLSSGVQSLHFPDEKDKFDKPYFYITDSLKNDDKKPRCSQIALKLMELIENNLQGKFPLQIFLATSTGGIKETEEVYKELSEQKREYNIFKRHFFSCIIDDIREKYKEIHNEPVTISTACSSSGHSLKKAYELIKHGIIDRALVIGVDSLSLTTMIGFDSLKLVSSKGTKPLAEDRDGLSLGEGGGAVLLECEPAGTPVAEVIGAYSNTDAYHISSPDPEGTQQKICIENAINDSGLKPEEIDYINAHGTGTLVNDGTEIKVIQKVFKSNPTVTSLKAFTGHTLGASAITEIAIALEMLKSGKIYQPKNFGNYIDGSLIPQNTIDKNVKYFLKNSFGFGGNNVSLVLKTLF